MTLKCQWTGGALGFLVVALGLSACVISPEPLVKGAKPINGDLFNVTLFRNFENGRAQSIDQRHYVWNGTRYLATWSDPHGESNLAVVPLGTDFLVQRTDQTETIASYWIARPIVAGAYSVFPVDEMALSSDDRKRICAPEETEGFCLIKSYDQLLEIAKVTARVGLSTTPDLAVLSNDITN